MMISKWVGIFSALAVLGRAQDEVDQIKCSALIPKGNPTFPINAMKIDMGFARVVVIPEIQEIFPNGTSVMAPNLDAYTISFGLNKLEPDGTIILDDMTIPYIFLAVRGPTDEIGLYPNCNFLLHNQTLLNHTYYFGPFPVAFRPDSVNLYSFDLEPAYYVDTDGNEIHLRDDAKANNAAKDNWYKVASGSPANLNTEPGLGNLNSIFVDHTPMGTVTPSDLQRIAEIWGSDLTVYPIRTNSDFLWIDDRSVADPKPFFNSTGVYPYGVAAVVPVRNILTPTMEVDARSSIGALMNNDWTRIVSTLGTNPPTVQPSNAIQSFLIAVSLVTLFFL